MYHTTEAIIEELYTLALRRLGWGPARRTVALMRQSSFISVHQDDQSLSWAVVDEFPGVPLSYADATLVALSRGLSISTVFSFDSDFRLAGFTTVP